MYIAMHELIIGHILYSIPRETSQALSHSHSDPSTSILYFQSRKDNLICHLMETLEYTGLVSLRGPHNCMVTVLASQLLKPLFPALCRVTADMGKYSQLTVLRSVVLVTCPIVPSSAGVYKASFSSTKYRRISLNQKKNKH